MRSQHAQRVLDPTHSILPIQNELRQSSVSRRWHHAVAALANAFIPVVFGSSGISTPAVSRVNSVATTSHWALLALAPAALMPVTPSLVTDEVVITNPPAGQYFIGDGFAIAESDSAHFASGDPPGPKVDSVVVIGPVG